MNSLYDFQNFLAMNLAKRLNTLILPSEITLGARKSISDYGLSATKANCIEVIYRGKTYVVAYSKFDLESALGNFMFADRLNTWNQTDDKVTILNNLANRAGIILDPNAYTLSNPDGSAQQLRTLTAVSDDCLTGAFTFTSNKVYVAPSNNFIRADRTDTGTTPGTGASTGLGIVNEAGYDWLRTPAGAYGAWSLGATMPFTGNWTMDCYLLFGSAPSGYNPLWSTEAALADATLIDDPSRHSPWIGYKAGYFGWYWNNTNTYPLAFPVGSGFRLTIRRTGNAWKWWINGVNGYNQSSWNLTSSGFRYFIAPRYSVPSKQYLRDFRYWNYSVSDRDMMFMLAA